MEEETKESEGREEAHKEATTGEGAPGVAGMPDKPVDRMTALELREFAKQIPGVAGVTAMKKEQLLSIVKEHLGIKDDKPLKAAVGGSIHELKARIADLKARKKDAREGRRDNEAAILRRRINRLKKMTRKAPRE